MLFRQKYPRGEGSRHSSFLSFSKDFFHLFRTVSMLFSNRSKKAIPFTTSRFLEGKEDLEENNSNSFNVDMNEIWCRCNFCLEQNPSKVSVLPQFSSRLIRCNMAEGWMAILKKTVELEMSIFKVAEKVLKAERPKLNHLHSPILKEPAQ